MTGRRRSHPPLRPVKSFTWQERLRDASHIEVVDVWLPSGVADVRVVLGIGYEGHTPELLLPLCPCDGVDGLVKDLRRAQTIAQLEHARPHPDYLGSIEL